jgi:hypothetical protein
MPLIMTLAFHFSVLRRLAFEPVENVDDGGQVAFLLTNLLAFSIVDWHALK